MTPTQAQQHALNELEELGGKPVVLQEDASLPNLARIQIATAARPMHVLSYNPKAAPELAYLVCFQCELAKRTLLTAPDERFNVASSADTYRQVEKLVQLPLLEILIQSVCRSIPLWGRRLSMTPRRRKKHKREPIDSKLRGADAMPSPDGPVWPVRLGLSDRTGLLS